MRLVDLAGDSTLQTIERVDPTAEADLARLAATAESACNQPLRRVRGNHRDGLVTPRPMTIPTSSHRIGARGRASFRYASLAATSSGAAPRSANNQPMINRRACSST